MDRQRLAEALAYEQQRRSRLANVIPTAQPGDPEVIPEQGVRSRLENLSSGLGQGGVNTLEGLRQLVTSPIETGRAMIEGGVEMIRDPALIAEALRETGRRAASGPLGLGEVIGESLNPVRMRSRPTMQELDVYHGSPHRFEEFDASKIGTGEGAQAYGHGIYFAENPNVAEGYRKTLGEQQNPYKANVAMSRMAALVDEFDGDVEKAADRFMQSVYETPKTKAKMRQNLIDEFQTYSPKGQLYKADLPDEMVDRMLDWDKPLSEQSEAVQKALKAAWPDIEDYSALSGEKLYQELSMPAFRSTPTSGSSRREAAAWLREVGIPGIKYADAGSRGQGGTGTRNFVVFPGEEKKVKILERDGQKISAGKGNQFPVVKAGDVVDGLKVRPETANVSSIKASLENYSVMPGIRSVSIDDFGEPGPVTGNVNKLDKRTRELADAISQSNEITPLIVVYSGSQNYILEGSHRIDALDALGKKKIPVIAVIDEDDPPAFWKGKR